MQKLLIPPLTDGEKGRGKRMDKIRTAEIEAECLRLIRLGVRQFDIAEMLGASKSSVSRWCQSAVKMSGDKSDRAAVQQHGRTLLQLMWARVKVTPTCWEWCGVIRENGYGSFNYKNAPVSPHRVLYEHFIGQIPNGFVVDHICNNPRCCNPDHLQAVTQNENLYFAKLRSNGKA